MSFIDMMANDIWSDADITNRTEAMVRSEFSLQAEGIINRKVSGAGLGVYALTVADQAEIGRFAMATQTAAMEGVAAKADMLLLQSALDHEAAQTRLAKYLLSVGVPEHTTQAPTDEKVLDEKTGLMTDVMAEQIIPAIAPLPATVTITDLDGTTTEAPNPAIAVDVAERAAAQAVLDAVFAYTLELVLLRNPPPVEPVVEVLP